MTTPRPPAAPAAGPEHPPRDEEALSQRLTLHNEGGHQAEVARAAAERRAATALHELSQPIHVLAGYIELMQDGGLSPDQTRRGLELMARAVERMRGLVADLRREARGATGRFIRINLRQVVELALTLTAGAGASGRVHLDLADVQVEGDPGELEQVVVNLVANALLAGPGPVGVRVARVGPSAVLEVADRGPGVPAALRDRVFEAFYTSRDDARGLGLSVSQRIVASHGGTLEVLDNPGGGALFRVQLPVVD